MDGRGRIVPQHFCLSFPHFFGVDTALDLFPISVLFDELQCIQDLGLEFGPTLIGPGLSLRGPPGFEQIGGLFPLCGTSFHDPEPTEFGRVARLDTLQCLEPRLDGFRLRLHFEEALTQERDFELGCLGAPAVPVDEFGEASEVCGGALL